MAARITEQIKAKCTKKPESFDAADEEEEDSKIWKFLMKLKCQTRALQAASKGTKFEVIFDEHRDAMWEVEDQLKECKEESRLKQVP